MTNNPQSMLERGTLCIMAACTLVLTGISIRRQLAPVQPDVGREQTPVKVADWATLTQTGHRVGDPSAPVTIVVFGDFECPACRAFETETEPAIRKLFPQKVAIVFRHFPLPYHRFAYPAARAAECAGLQSRFDEFEHLVYAQADSLGLKPFTRFAEESGVPDTAAFAACNARTSRVPAIEADLAEARLIGADRTPVVIINGLMLRTNPDSAEAERSGQAALSGRSRR